MLANEGVRLGLYALRHTAQGRVVQFAAVSSCCRRFVSRSDGYGRGHQEGERKQHRPAQIRSQDDSRIRPPSQSRTNRREHRANAPYRHEWESDDARRLEAEHTRGPISSTPTTSPSSWVRRERKFAQLGEEALFGISPCMAALSAHPARRRLHKLFVLDDGSTSAGLRQERYDTYACVARTHLRVMFVLLLCVCSPCVRVFTCYDT